MNHPFIPKHNSNANIHSIDEFMSISSSVEVLIVDSDTCNAKCLTELDLSSFSSIKVFEVGDYSFSFVNEVKLIGLNQLERVVIGKNSFTKCKDDWPKNNPSRHFYLKNCERVKELRIGCYSFNDYSVCEIESVPSLEVIEMGELNEESHNFKHTSEMELKSCCDGMK